MQAMSHIRRAIGAAPTFVLCSLLDLAIVASAQTDHEASREVSKVVVGGDGPAGAHRWGTDAYQLGEAVIECDTLTATVSYGGGCRDHKFTLVLADAFMMMDPVRLAATLAHEANEDPCEAWLTEDIAFDLTAVKETHGAEGPVVLLLSLVDGSEIELVYDWP